MIKKTILFLFFSSLCFGATPTFQTFYEALNASPLSGGRWNGGSSTSGNYWKSDFSYSSLPFYSWKNSYIIRCYSNNGMSGLYCTQHRIYACPTGTTTNPANLQECVPNCLDGEERNLETGACEPVCDPETEEQVNGQCLPLCGSNSTRNSDTLDCECNAGYSGENCQPELDCPQSMLYEAKDYPLFTHKRCIPNPDLTPEQCANLSNTAYLTPTTRDSLVPLYYGSGCYDVNYAYSSAINESIDLAIAWAPIKLHPDDIVIATVSKLFNKGKNLWDDIVNAFKNSDEVVPPNLQTHEPLISNMRMGEDGVMFDVTPTPRLTDDAYKNAAYQKYLDENKIKPDEPTPPIDTNYPRYDIPSDYDDLFYKGGDSAEFSNTMLGTANLTKDKTIPSLSGVTETPTQTVTNLKSNLNGITETKSYPTTLQKTYENTISDGTLQANYKGHITYPDGTKTQLSIDQLTHTDGSITSTVKSSYVFKTTSGDKIFQTEYTATRNTMGEIINSTKEPTTITKVNTDGSVSTTTNAPDPATISQTQPPVNIQPLYDQLKTMNQKIDEIMEYRPKEADDLANALKNLSLALTDWDVSIQDAFDFLGGAKDQIAGFFDKFDEAKTIFEDEPTLEIPSGSCPFTISGKNRTGGPTNSYSIDPCKYISPYKPILTIFFTVFLTFSVLGFAFKHMFNVGGNS